jgi:predicted TIM-barrel fold metal-dependent hydrolase
MLRHALTVVSADRLMFSTDYPFQMPTRSQIDASLQELPDDAATESFASGTARRLFGL